MFEGKKIGGVLERIDTQSVCSIMRGQTELTKRELEATWNYYFIRNRVVKQ